MIVYTSLVITSLFAVVNITTTGQPHKMYFWYYHYSYYHY